MSNFYRTQLAASVAALDTIYKKHHVRLIPGQGLHDALEESRQFIRWVPMPAAATETEVIARAGKTSAILSIASTLIPLDAAGFPITRYLKQLATGSTDYGTPQLGGTGKQHFLKDFEAELFVLLNLYQAGLPVQLLPNPSDPIGEMEVAGMFVEVKHPDGIKQILKYAREFNTQLMARNAYGVFVIALEDAFGMASDARHVDEAAQSLAFRTRAQSIDTLAKSLLPRLARMNRVVGCVTMMSFLEVVGEDVIFSRKSNALLLDESAMSTAVRATAESICRVFNPDFRLYSQVKAKL